MSDILFTRFTSETVLAKVISKGADGSLSKKASAQFYAGSFETVRVPVESPGTAPRLVSVLQTFTRHQALSPSLSLGAESGKITTEARPLPHAVTRTKKNFGYRPDELGLLVLDYDPPKGSTPLTPDELKHRLFTIWPEAARGIVVHWFSGSSLIFDGDKQLAPATGQRIYVALNSQAAIPETIKALNKLAWLMGLGGHVHISKIGSLLVRGLFDSAMADAGGRLDFAPAGAVTEGTLEQRRGLPTTWADYEPLPPPPPLSAAQEAEVAALIEAAKLRAKPEAEAVSAAYLAEKQQAAAVEAAKTGQDSSEARDRVKREHEALQGGVVLGGAVLIHVNEAGKEIPVRADDLLSDPKFWHGKSFLSPHEPDHRGRSADAMAFLLQAQPILYDLNDQIVYRLQKQPVALEVVQGARAALADQIATELAKGPDFMQCAGRLVRSVDGTFAPLARPMLSFMVGTHIALFRTLKGGKASALDVDQQCLEMVHALLTERARKVIGQSTIPLVDIEGRVIERHGLDDKTGIYLALATEGEGVSVPINPTKAETIEALRRLWKPFSLYEWTTPHDRAAVLATVLTVPLRPTIAAAPGLFVDAPAQSAGKSSVCAAVLVLVQGDRSNMKSWTHDSEIELEKYLLSLAHKGAPAVAWDNLTKTFDSSTIATAVIEGRVSARLLGATTALSPIFRAMWLASGNNASIARDCSTRFLQARIACPDGQPHRTAFPFEPSEAARLDRMGIVRAIITVHRAWHAAGCPNFDGITTRFPDWGRTIRPIVSWLSSSGLASEAGLGELGDPADAILNRISDSDPDTDNAIALLTGLRGVFDGAAFSARELGQIVRHGKDATGERFALWEAVTSYFPRDQHNLPPQRLTALLRNRRDRSYAGLKLLMLPKPATREGERNGQLFAVVEV